MVGFTHIPSLLLAIRRETPDKLVQIPACQLFVLESPFHQDLANATGFQRFLTAALPKPTKEDARHIPNPTGTQPDHASKRTFELSPIFKEDAWPEPLSLIPVIVQLRPMNECFRAALVISVPFSMMLSSM